MNEIKSEIKEYIIENFLFGDRDTLIEDDDSFMESGILDSTGILELITFIEDRYDIKLDDDEILPENLDSLNNLETFIKKKMN